MIKYKIQQGKEIVNSNGGILLAGKILEKVKVEEIVKELGWKGKKIQQISDIVKSWIGLFIQGLSDYEDINLFQKELIFRTSFNIEYVYSSNRFQELAERLSKEEKGLELLKRINIEMLKQAEIGRIFTKRYKQEYIPCDVDVSVFNNSKSKKEGVGKTYKNVFGYAPIFAYVGKEGYMINCELREGSQHCQKDTPEFLEEVIKNLEELKIKEQVLFRLDSGNDAVDTLEVLRHHGCNYIIKRNQRKESEEKWLDIARSVGELIYEDDKQKKYIGSVSHIKPRGFDNAIEVVFEVTEYIADEDGHELLFPKIEVSTYWTSIGECPQKIIELYHDHGTSEQFHSELKTDMDIERFPSGKFKVNSIILLLAQNAFNILRKIGIDVLKFKKYAPVTMNVARRRLKSVIKDLIYIGCKVVYRARYIIFQFGKNCKWFKCLFHLHSFYCRT